MGFSFANLKRWLPITGVTLAVACSAGAQPAGRGPGEAILFSSPDDGGASSNMPSLAAKPPELLDLANAVQSPVLKFGAASESGPPPELQPPPISPAEIQRMQRLLDERKNWALMTPEEILGMPTPEKILGIPDHDAFGRPKNETVVVQYYERQEELQARTNNDNYDAADSASRWGFSDSRELQMNPSIWAPAGNRPVNSMAMNQFLNGTPDSRSAPAQTRESAWSKSFSLPAPPPDPTPEQQAAMEQFRQLLQPRALPDNTAKAPTLGSPVFSPPSTAPNPVSSLAPGQLVEIPVGASFTPLSSGIAMPAGVTPLPALFSPNNTAPPVFAPEWKPQLPPWMSSVPQLGVIPQRKF